MRSRVRVGAPEYPIGDVRERGAESTEGEGGGGVAETPPSNPKMEAIFTAFPPRPIFLAGSQTASQPGCSIVTCVYRKSCTSTVGGLATLATAPRCKSRGQEPKAEVTTTGEALTRAWTRADPRSRLDTSRVPTAPAREPRVGAWSIFGEKNDIRMAAWRIFFPVTHLDADVLLRLALPFDDWLPNRARTVDDDVGRSRGLECGEHEAESEAAGAEVHVELVYR